MVKKVQNVFNVFCEHDQSHKDDQSHKVKAHMFLSKRFANDSTDVQKFATISFSPARLSEPPTKCS